MPMPATRQAIARAAIQIRSFFKIADSPTVVWSLGSSDIATAFLKNYKSGALSASRQPVSGRHQEHNGKELSIAKAAVWGKRFAARGRKQRQEAGSRRREAGGRRQTARGRWGDKVKCYSPFSIF